MKDAVDFLIDEHSLHRRLLIECANSPLPFEELRRELIHHVDLEESILYTALLAVDSLKKEIEAAWDDHKELMGLLQDMDQCVPGSEQWLEKFNHLEKTHLDHMAFEEKDLFPRIRAALAPEVLQDLMLKLKEQKVGKASSVILYPVEAKSHETLSEKTVS